MDIEFELIVLDDNGELFDSAGIYGSLEKAREYRDMYISENPGEKYRIDKITREIVE